MIFSKPLYEEKEIIFKNLSEDIEDKIFEISYQLEHREKFKKCVEKINLIDYKYRVRGEKLVSKRDNVISYLFYPAGNETVCIGTTEFYSYDGKINCWTNDYCMFYDTDEEPEYSEEVYVDSDDESYISEDEEI